MQKLLILILLILANYGLYAETALVSARCGANNSIKHFYYPTQAEATANHEIDILQAISYPEYGILKPYWDIRYVNPISKYINGGTYDYPNHALYTGLDVNSGINNVAMGTETSKFQAEGSITQSECVNGYITGGVMVNTYDAPQQTIEFGGAQSTLAYNFGFNSRIHPWKPNESGNLILQGYFDKPWYGSPINNDGSEVNFIAYFYNKSTGKQISYVIRIYRASQNEITFMEVVRNDTSTSIPFVSTFLDDNAKTYVTKSPFSNNSSQEYRGLTTDDNIWNNFYRANITYANFKRFLLALNITSNPDEWAVTRVGVQYEAVNGKVSFAGSFRGFEVYVNDDVLLPDNDITPIALNTIINESWNANTTNSTHRNNSFARFYNFTLSHRTKVTLDLTSSTDTYLYLLSGLSQTGTILSENDDGGSGDNSKIVETLPIGIYTIEATTNFASELGSFSLHLNVAVPSKVSNLTNHNLTSSNAKLVWSDNANTELGYKVYQNHSLIATLPSSTTSYQLTNLNDNTYYVYDVVPYNEGGEAAKTTIAFTTLSIIPSMPSNLTVSNVDTTSAQLKWKDNANNETGFRLYKDDVLIAILNPNITTYKISGLEARRKYNFRIKAFNDAGYSNSINISFTTEDDYAWLIPMYHIILN